MKTFEKKIDYLKKLLQDLVEELPFVNSGAGVDGMHDNILTEIDDLCSDICDLEEEKKVLETFIEDLENKNADLEEVYLGIKENAFSYQADLLNQIEDLKNENLELQEQVNTLSLDNKISE